MIRTEARPLTVQRPSEAPLIAGSGISEQQYHLPGGISGSIKELTADPSAATSSLRSAQAVMRNLYEITGVDEVSRGKMQRRETRERSGLVLDMFRPDLNPAVREGMTEAVETSETAMSQTESLITTAAVIYGLQPGLITPGNAGSIRG